MDPKLGGWLFPRGYVMHFHFGMCHIGQDGVLYKYYLLPI